MLKTVVSRIHSAPTQELGIRFEWWVLRKAGHMVVLQMDHFQEELAWVCSAFAKADDLESTTGDCRVKTASATCC